MNCLTGTEKHCSCQGLGVFFRCRHCSKGYRDEGTFDSLSSKFLRVFMSLIMMFVFTGDDP